MWLNDLHRFSQHKMNLNPGFPVQSPEQLWYAIYRTECSKHLLNDSVYKSKMIPDVLEWLEKMVLAKEF